MGRGLGSAALLVLLGACGLPHSYVVLLPQEGGKSGAVEVTGDEGKTVIAEPWKAAGLSGGGTPKTVSKDEVQKTFGKALAAAPKEPARFILYFQSDTAELTPESRKRLPDVLAAVRERPVPDVDVVGHTDAAGPESYNDALALRRAQRISDEVVAIGVDRKVIEVGSHGKRDPLVPTRNGVHEPRNRRVEIIVR